MPASAITIIGLRALTSEATGLLETLGIDAPAFWAAANPANRDWDDFEDQLDAVIAAAQPALDQAALLLGADPRMFALTLHGDDSEMADCWPREYVLGVQLDSRYAPTWIDRDQPSGTDGVLALTAAMRAEILSVREAISTHLPAFAAASIFHKPVWY